MPLNMKTKVSVLAKDFELKNKDITDIVTQFNPDKKVSSTTLENEDLNIIFEYLTQQHQVEDINPFLTRTVKVKEEPKIETAPEVKQNPPQQPATIQQPRPTQEQKPQSPLQQQQPRPHTPSTQQQPRPVQNTQQQQRPNTPPRQPRPNNQQQPNFRQPQPQQTQPQTKVFEKDNVSRATTPQNTKNMDNTNTIQQKQQPQQKQQTKREFTAPAFNNQRNKPNENKQNQPQNRPSNNFRQPIANNGKFSVDIISESNIKLEAGVKSETARIVDTRTTNVDLSKYDEKLDKFANEQKTKQPVYDNFGGNRQKIKKNTQSKITTYDRFGKPIDKEKQALEKMQKMALDKEKAKRKQLQITLPEQIMVSDLASKLHVTSAEIVKRLFMMGTKATVTEVIDYDSAALVALELGAKVEKEVVITIEDKLFDETEDTSEQLVTRSPVVVVMGHVDHGKTSLLDAIKHSNVTAGEAGGITQHIGAYRVKTNDREITFLDTPGHAAFTAMRSRGAQVTDIAILVVAANDGVMPQTIEAINHAKAANVAIIVAINKIDMPAANIDRVKQDLTVQNIIPEDWGGDTVCVPVSAITKEGIDELLEMVILTADMMELKANPNRLAKGTIIEAKLDKGKGPVATVLVQNGTLNVGDIVIAGTTVGRIRAMTDYKGEPLKSAGPSYPVEIIGLSETPNAGDDFRTVEDEKMARELAEQRKSAEKEETFKTTANVTLEDLFAQVASGVKELNIIIKADVNGSVEALKSSLEKESTEEVKIKIIHKGVGGINESDVMLASASNAIILGFNVRPDKAAIDTAERQGVDVRTYRVIYECIEEINAAIKGMLAPKFKEVVLGHAQVRQTIRVPNIGTIAGSYVQDGKIARNSQIRVVRDGIVIFEDKISSLKRFKDDAREVHQGFECGVGLDRFNDIKELDILESYVMEEIAR